MIVAFAYLFEKDRGSEYQVGYDALDIPLKSRLCLATSTFEFDRFEAQERIINGLKFKVAGKGKIVLDTNFVKREPSSAMGHRLFFVFWILFCYLRYFKLRANRVFWFLTLVQVVTPNPYFIYAKQKVVAGPLGGQPNIYKYQFLPTKLRLKNFLLVKILYSIAFINFLRNGTAIFISPLLAKTFSTKNKTIIPAISIDQTHENFNLSHLKKQRRSIVFYYRDAEIKLPQLGLEILSSVAESRPDLELKVIGDVDKAWRQKYPKLNYIGYKSQQEVGLELQNALLNFSPSQELSGFFQLEAVLNGCVNLSLHCSGNNIKDKVITPTKDFCVWIEPTESRNAVIQRTVNKLISVLSNQELIAAEHEFQLAQLVKFDRNTRLAKISELLERFV